MKFLNIAITCLFVIPVISREKCEYDLYKEKKIEAKPSIQEKINDIERHTLEYVLNYNKRLQKKSPPPRIPIVVHVLYANDRDNISEEQVRSQIKILNDDFAKLNGNFDDTPDPFKELASEVNIQFCMAGVDEDGNETDGIVRKQSSDANSSNYADESRPWDNNRYLNVWLADLGRSLLGMATPPGFGGRDDGVLVNTPAWGDVGTAEDFRPNHLGRTATHEIGHYFNLNHIWGGYGGCDDDDRINDTPNQDRDSFGCPSFPQTDACTKGDGINFNNYMDYTDDGCMTNFSKGQAMRMEAALDGPRSELLGSEELCGEEVVEIQPSLEIESSSEIIVRYVQNQIHVHTHAINSDLKSIDLLNVSGKSLMKENNPNSKHYFNVEGLNSGVYLVKIEFAKKVQPQVQKVFIPVR